MADDNSNIDEVGQWISGILEGIDFTMPGADQSLGRDMAGVVANGIIDRSVPDAQAPDGSTWAANEPEYAARKRARYDADQPGILTGQMLSLESVKGELTLAPAEVTMKYGTGESAKRARNGAEPPKASDPPTDRQKAEWFTEGGRPFYELDDQINEAVVKEAEDAIEKHLEGL